MTLGAARRPGRTPTVAVIGAGLGGIAMGVNLVRRGISTLTIFEASSSPGGTWWHNRYPGAECDVPSALYSYSFKPHDWSRTHGRQAEILAYVQETIDDFGLRDRLELDTAVVRVEWHDDRMQHLVTLGSGERRWFDVVVSAVGMLNAPSVPSWPGTFAGPVVHSARWDDTVDLTGRRVAVIGAGASAAQIVPALQPVVGELLSFQREPGWVFPKVARDYTPAERLDQGRRRRQRRERRRILRMIDRSQAGGSDPAAVAAVRARCEAYIAEVFADRPDLREIVTPSFAPRCKRNVSSDTFYPALAQPNVRLVHRSVEALTARGVVDDRGEEHEVDAIVLATGFRAASFLPSTEVVGRDGRELHDVWGDDPAAYLGITVPGFPNFYLLYGPNTHGTVVSFVLERQAELVARDVRRLARVGGGAIEVRDDVHTTFQARLHEAIAGVDAWSSGCHNFYLSASGRNVVQWPWSHGRYWFLTRATRRSSTRLRRLTAAGRSARQAETAPAAGS